MVVSEDVTALSAPPAPSISSAICIGVRVARALERHVLKKMGDAVLIVRFGPRARVDEHAHGGGFEASHAVAYDPADRY